MTLEVDWLGRVGYAETFAAMKQFTLDRLPETPDALWMCEHAPVFTQGLAGIRYGLIERICAEAGIPFSLRRIARDEVFGADELLLSSASKEVLPVVTLDGRSIGAGSPGPIYQALYAGYQRAKARSPQDQGVPA